jgi:hypothetical protein
MAEEFAGEAASSFWRMKYPVNNCHYRINPLGRGSLGARERHQ